MAKAGLLHLPSTSSSRASTSRARLRYAVLMASAFEYEPGEIGEAIGLIPRNPRAALGQFEGVECVRGGRCLVLQRPPDAQGCRKVDLVEEGFDLSSVPDLLYFADQELDAFVTLGTPTYQRITQGQVRV